MAISIKSIPNLKQSEAKAFVEKANANVSKRASVNFSKQVAATNAILNKAKLK